MPCFCHCPAGPVLVCLKPHSISTHLGAKCRHLGRQEVSHNQPKKVGTAGFVPISQWVQASGLDLKQMPLAPPHHQRARPPGSREQEQLFARRWKASALLVEKGPARRLDACKAKGEHLILDLPSQSPSEISRNLPHFNLVSASQWVPPTALLAAFHDHAADWHPRWAVMARLQRIATLKNWDASIARPVALLIRRPTTNSKPNLSMAQSRGRRLIHILPFLSLLIAGIFLYHSRNRCRASFPLLAYRLERLLHFVNPHGLPLHRKLHMLQNDGHAGFAQVNDANNH